MKRVVVVLAEDDSKKATIQSTVQVPAVQQPWMCRIVTPEEYDEISLFSWEQFGFFTRDHKLDDYLSSDAVEGVICIINYSTLIARSAEITKRLQGIRCRPLLLLIENNIISPISEKPIVSSSESFIVKYLNSETDKNEGIHAFHKLLMTKRKTDTVVAVASTSVEVSDSELIAMFETATLPIKMWDHYGRLRVVFLALETRGYTDTISPDGWLCKNWRKYKTSIGHSHLWNYSLTRFWVEQLRVLIRKNESFSYIYRDNPVIHNGSLHKDHYTNDLLFTDYARSNWVQPNKSCRDCAYCASRKN